MVAPNYAEARSNLAKKMGLGRKAALSRKAA
jgi:predicted transcriptional regulator